MDFVSENELVYLEHDFGRFKNVETGQEFDWTKVKLANPLTFENHELAYKEGLEFSKLKKGDRVLVTLEMQPTSKKSKVIVSNYALVD